MEVNLSQLDKSPLPFLHLMQELKHIERTGWLRTIEKPESVGSHSFRLALLGGFAPHPLDPMKCMFIGLCHDLAESVVGDIPTYAGISKERKHKLEYFGFRYIVELVKPCNAVLADKILTAWLDYEEARTPEGRWVREMDKLECMVQAHEYEQKTYGEKDLEEFQGLSSKIRSPDGMAWLDLLRQERSAHLSKRKRRLPVIFITGALSVGATQCALLSQEFGFQHISLEGILREKSEDQTYLHAEFVRDCLKEEVDVPVGLVVGLLERKIEEGMNEGRQWSLVHGFPKSMEQVLEFERKAQKTNYTLFLKCSAEGDRAGSPGQPYGADDEPDAWKARSVDLKDYLRSMEGYFKEINCDGSEAEVYGLVKNAVDEFIEYAEREK
ncbi:P-loop containing nucleoside triphosphate hydrolase protein [Lojkania enalia]|uniref:P-loop containing nucleoside triphosphate hydrolase protein n=1 Tax=Lojkania enalia TaxID=147567 RepID=A0A9P4JYA3_9PLEO|nr:P-loop containing nucleoside triphosphate hydrolase protein [Didymosphaeria enalia]